jgi:hypothetical protein
MSMEFVMLGKTVPEPTNERVEQYVCSAGWSPEGGLIRLYPLGLRATPRRWSVSVVPVERHPGNKDSRAETWRPVGAFGSVGTLPLGARRDILEKHIMSGMIEANAARISLAVVRPIQPHFYLAGGVADSEPSYRLYSDGEARKAKERFAYMPRIKFRTEDGRPHDLQMRDWGIWELMRKSHQALADMTSTARESYVGNSLRMNDDTLFLIGNYAQYRNSWLVIAALNTPL